MRITPKKVIISLTMGLFAFCGTGIAAATIIPASGGWWDYGENKYTVWSNYYHGSKDHASSVKGSIYVRSNCVGPAQTSLASAPSTWFRDSSYYQFC